MIQPTTRISEKEHIILTTININGTRRKLVELNQWISENTPDVIVLQETLSMNDIPINGYSTISQRKKGERGQAMYIKENMKYNIIDTSEYTKEGMELQGIELQLKKQQGVTIINTYCRDKKLNKIKAKEMLNKETNCILIGDWNAKMDIPIHNKCNENGTILQNAYENNELRPIIPDAFTRFDPTGRSPSCIDFLVTKMKTNFTITRVSVGDDIGSDHRPVTYTIAIKEAPEKVQISPHPNFRKADWESYRKQIDELVDTLPLIIEDKSSIDHAIDKITELIQKADNKAIPRKTFIMTKQPLPRFIVNMITEKHKLKNKLQNDNRLDTNTRTGIKRKINYLKKRIDRESKSYRREVLDRMWTETEKKTPYGFYKLAKRMSEENIISKTTYPIQDNNGTSIKNEIDKAEAFRKLYEEIYSTPDDHNGHERLHNTINDFAHEIANHFGTVKPQHDDTDIDIRVNSKDIWNNIKRCKNTTPGSDQITYLHLKQLPSSAKNYLSKIYSACLKCTYFPDKWKEGTTILLPKPGKDTRSTKNYRPITLLSTLGKTLEKIINERIKSFIETNNLLPDSQAGFRSNRSTQDQLLRLIENIATGFQNGNVTLACYHDIEKAFDKMWTNGLLYKLYSSTKLKIHSIGLIYSFLSNRSVRFKINDVLSSPLTLKAGTPQGAILSPTLFNLWVSDIPQPLRRQKKTHLSQFADDIATWSTARSVETARAILQEYNNSLITWCKKWKIQLSPRKTQLVCYSRKSLQSRACAHQYIDNIRVEAVKEAKFLGITIDEKLKFKTQQKENIQKLKAKVAKFSTITGSVKFPRASRITGLKILKSMVIPLTGYAHTIAVMYPDGHFSKQDEIIQRGARKALHVCKTLSRTYVIEKAKLKPSKEVAFTNGRKYINNDKRSTVIKSLVANKKSTARQRRTFETPLDKLLREL
jgi:endonuclease/exonuclease/phosphatase family metal-dependent hydrolase